jgi:acyl-CoA synthetase (AMP-forming)/AMP-acid ligase II/thioesterase domain-containing protein/acyl carrier protein
MIDAKQSIEHLIRANARHAPSAPSIVSAAGDALTWTQLVEQLEQTHAALRAFGFGPEDRIAVALENGPVLAAAFLTVAACVPCAPLNPMYSADEFAFYLDDLHAQALITSRTAARSAAEAAARLGIPVLKCETDESAPGRFTLKCPLQGRKSAAGSVGGDSVALLLHTSGTTSKPKLVPLRQRNLIASARNMVETLRLSATDRCLNLMPLFHIHGLVGGLLAPLAAGGSAVCPPTFRPGTFLTALRSTRPTWYTAVPTIHRATVAEAAQQEEIIERCGLRFIRSSSAPLPASLYAELVRIFRVPVLEAYSMTEAAHQMTCNPLQPGKQKPGTVGVPAGPEVAVIDESGKLLPAGETGEVVIRGPTIMSGYEANPEANAGAFVGGWFRTGDLGRFDSDGYLVLTGRIKEQINRGGEKIAPLEIDKVLLSHPGVSEVATFGFAHPTLGEEIAAAVVLRTQCDATPAQLQAFLREHLAPFKVPRRILIVEKIPKGPTGKIQRRQLGRLLGLNAAESRETREIDEAREQGASLELELLQLWQRMLGCNSIGLDDDFFEKGGDSLRAIQMLLEFEKMVGHSIPETILFQSSTIRGLAKDVVELNFSRATPLVHVQPKGTGPPLFFFHGDYAGRGYYTRRLARLLGPDQPFIAVAQHGLGQEPFPSSITEMAAERIPLILEVRPQGPFRLCGYCRGAMVALETARLLTETGHVVEWLALIDWPPFNLRPTARILHQSVDTILRIVRNDWEERYPRVALAIDMLWQLLSDTDQKSLAWVSRDLANFRDISLRELVASAPVLGGGPSGAAPGPDDRTRQERQLDRIYNRLFRQYFPTKIEVPVVYFSADYTGKPLRNLSSKLEVITVPGGHWGCITSHAEALAAHLRRLLRASSRSRPFEMPRQIAVQS